MIKTRILTPKNPKSAILFADTHIHDFKQFNEMTPNGIGTRSLYSIDAVLAVIQYARDNSIDLIFFLGDFFHHRNILYSAVFDATCKKLNGRIPIIGILGNHDRIFNDDSSSNILSYIPNFDVVTEPTLFKIEGSDCILAACPFFTDEKKLMESLQALSEVSDPKNTILLTHLTVYGAKANKYYEFKEGLTIEDLDNLSFMKIYSGHVHTRQTIYGKRQIVEYCGILIQQNFSEWDIESGFFVLDLDKRSHEFVPLNSIVDVPNFVVTILANDHDISSAEKAVKSSPLNYYKFIVRNPKLNIDSLIKKTKFYTIEYDTVSLEQNRETDDLLPDVLTFNMDIYTYLNTYFDSVHAAQNELSKEKVDKILSRVLERI